MPCPGQVPEDRRDGGRDLVANGSVIPGRCCQAIAGIWWITRKTPMLHLELCSEDGKSELHELDLPCEIGRAVSCQLRLSSWRVARRHVGLASRESGVFLEDYGSLTGTLLNGKRVFRHGPLQVGDEIGVGPCLLKVKAI